MLSTDRADDPFRMTKSARIRLWGGAVALVGVGLLHEKILVGGLIAAGRNHTCSLGLALNSMEAAKRRHAKIGFIHDNSKLLENDEKEGLQLWQTPRGKFWMPVGSVKEVLYDLAEQENGIYELGGHAVRPGDVVLDCGGNVGVYTRKALDRGASKVITVEPAPENLKCLRRNFAKEIEEGRVIIYAKGVWDKDDVLPMNVDPKNSAGDSFVIKRNGSFTINLPLTTIDKLAEELKIDKLDFIKFDIEGAERNALRGGKNTIARFHPRMAICVYHLPDDPIAVPQAVAEAWSGYKHQCGPCVVSDLRIMPEVYFFFGS